VTASFARALERDAPLAAVALGRSLRAAGLPVTPDRSATFAAACALTGREGLYWTARLAFVTAREQVPAFDAVYAQVVGGITDPAGQSRGDPTAPPPPKATRRPAVAGAVGARPAGRRAAFGGGGAVGSARLWPAGSAKPPTTRA